MLLGPGFACDGNVGRRFNELHLTLLSSQIFTTETSVSHVAREIQVPHPFTNYTVTVRLRSRAANKTEEFWSPPVSAMARTLAKGNREMMMFFIIIYSYMQRQSSSQFPSLLYALSVKGSPQA